MLQGLQGTEGATGPSEVKGGGLSTEAEPQMPVSPVPWESAGTLAGCGNV